MTPRDVIARDLRTTYAFGSIDTNARADLVISALTAAGFRVLGPAEVDQVTLEKAIAIVEAAAPTATGEWNVHRAWALSSIPSLRAIGRKA